MLTGLRFAADTVYSVPLRCDGGSASRLDRMTHVAAESLQVTPHPITSLHTQMSGKKVRVNARMRRRGSHASLSPRDLDVGQGNLRIEIVCLGVPTRMPPVCVRRRFQIIQALPSRNIHKKSLDPSNFSRHGLFPSLRLL